MPDRLRSVWSPQSGRRAREASRPRVCYTHPIAPCHDLIGEDALTATTDAERIEIERLHALAEGEPSEAAWSEIHAAILRYLKRLQAPDVTFQEDRYLRDITLTLDDLQELLDIPSGPSRQERIQELIERVEGAADREQARVQAVNAERRALDELWDDVFVDLDAALSHWPDALRAATRADAETMRSEPRQPCWRIYRHVDLGSTAGAAALASAHPQLSFTLFTPHLAMDFISYASTIREVRLEAIEPEAWSAFVRKISGAPLRAFHVTSTSISADDVRVLAERDLFAKIDSLTLRDCDLHADAIAQLVEHLDPNTIRHLDLALNPLGSSGLCHLLSLTGARPHHLDLTGCLLDSSGASRIARSRISRDLTHLVLADNHIEDDGAAALAATSKLVGLRHLDLRYTRINDDAAHALADSVHLLDLRELDVRDNRLTEDGLMTLATSRHLDRLEMLHVAGNHLEPRTWRRLSSTEVAHTGLRAHLDTQRRSA